MQERNNTIDLSQLERLASAIKDSRLMPAHLKGNVADLVYIMLTGAELGLSPMQSLRSFYPVQTRNGMALSLTADAMLAVMYANGIQFPVLSFTPTEARIEAVRPDGQRYATVFTMEDAKRAGLVERSPMYQRYPDRMLRSRAIARVFRDLAPHLCGSNIWTPEELEDEAAPASRPAAENPDTGVFTVAVRQQAPEPPPAEEPEPVQDSPAEPVPENVEQDAADAADEAITPEPQPAPATPWYEIPLPEGYVRQLLSELKAKALAARTEDPRGQGRIMVSILRYCGLNPHGDPETLLPYVKRLHLISNIDPDCIRNDTVDKLASRISALVDPVSKFVSDNNLHQRMYSLLYTVMAIADVPPVTMIHTLNRNREEFAQWLDSVTLASTPHELWEKLEWLASFIQSRKENT